MFSIRFFADFTLTIGKNSFTFYQPSSTFYKTKKWLLVQAVCYNTGDLTDLFIEDLLKVVDVDNLIT